MSSETKPLPTIWEVPDDLWKMMECLLARFDPPKRMGRPRIDARKALNGIIFRARTGCQWNQLPDCFGDDASVHRTQQRWEQLGIFDALWALVLSRCPDLDGVDWVWQSADGCLCKARGALKRGRKTRASARTPRIVVSQASRKSLLVEADGGPLALVISAANVNDAQLLATTLDAIVVERPQPSVEAPQYLCLDKGYDNQTGQEAALAAGYLPHIRRIGEEKLDAQAQKTHPARRWVVERPFGWLSRWRGILVRWEKRPANYLGVCKLACALGFAHKVALREGNYTKKADF